MKVERSPWTNQDYIREHCQRSVLSPTLGAELSTPPKVQVSEVFFPIPEEVVQHSHLSSTVVDHRQEMVLLDIYFTWLNLKCLSNESCSPKYCVTRF